MSEGSAGEMGVNFSENRPQVEVVDYGYKVVLPEGKTDLQELALQKLAKFAEGPLFYDNRAATAPTAMNERNDFNQSNRLRSNRVMAARSALELADESGLIPNVDVKTRLEKLTSKMSGDEYLHTNADQKSAQVKELSQITQEVLEASGAILSAKTKEDWKEALAAAQIDVSQPVIGEPMVNTGTRRGILTAKDE